MADGAVALQGEIKQAFDAYQGTIEALLKKNDERLDNVAKRFDDVITKDELKKIDAAVTEMKEAFNKEVAALKRSGRAEERTEEKQRLAAFDATERKAFDEWFRTGQDGGIKASYAQGIELAKQLGLKDVHGVEIKDLSTVIAQDGGYMVRPEYEAEMIEILNETSPMRNIARVQEIGKAEVEIPVNKKGATAAWTTELAERVRTLTSQIEMLKFGASEIYGLPLATLSILEDADFDVEGFLYSETIEAMDLAENLAFVAGDGLKKPRGFTVVDKVADSSWAWGKLGYVVTGASGAFKPSFPGASPSTASENGADCLFDLIYSFKRPYRRNLTWTMNRLTLRDFRKLKDGDGKYVSRDFYSEDRGIITSILGYPVEEFEDMDDIGANKFAAAIGDFNRGYLITDRVGLQVRRDEITSPGNVIFHMRRRVGGDVRDFQAIKFLKFGTS